MEKTYITHYYYPGTDPWKNIMNLPEEEAFRLAGELADAHPDTTSFGRFADFDNYYPARKKADEFVRTDGLRRLPYLRSLCIQPPVTDVFCDRIRKQEHILLHDTDVLRKDTILICLISRPSIRIVPSSTS